MLRAPKLRCMRHLSWTKLAEFTGLLDALAGQERETSSPCLSTMHVWHEADASEMYKPGIDCTVVGRWNEVHTVPLANGLNGMKEAAQV